jgi:polyisoprenoid-binding protein YceI
MNKIYTISPIGNIIAQTLEMVISMMIKSKLLCLTLLCLVITGFLSAQAQAQDWILDTDSSIVVEITGTSTLHDWKVTCAGVQEVPTQLSFDFKNQNQNQIKEFGFKVPVDSMDGGRGSSMNTKIFDAFQSSQNPFVQYKQNQPATISETSEQNVFTITSIGTLSMAGTDKPVTIECTGTIENDNLAITGSKDLKISDYGMVPPSAMFGQIKTNDNVVVSFKFHYIKQ